MRAAAVQKIHAIRESVDRMIAERDSGDVRPIFHLNQLWRNLERFTEYVRHLPPGQLENIRAHTGAAFFTPNTRDQDVYDGYRIRTDEEALAHPLIGRYLQHIEGLPDEYHCSEPATTDLVAQIGIKYHGRIINHDIVKEQACIANLYNLDVLPRLRDTKWVIAEVGSGYGQLAHQLSRALGNSGCYVCIDYPETLFWSSTFLALNNDPDGIYIYNPATAGGFDLKELTTRYQFVMLPNYVSDSLHRLESVDLVINQNSMQEMTEEQVRYYLELFSESLKGWIYSYNSNRQFMNRELHTPLFDLLTSYFDGWPTSSFYENFYGEIWPVTDRKCLFFGHPKRMATRERSAEASGAVWISGRRAEVVLQRL